MTVDMEAKWRAAAPFEPWLGAAERNVELWRSLYERAKVPGALVGQGAEGPYRFLVLAEDWCGDAVNTVPWLAKLAERVDGWELRLLNRDEHLDLMETHTTNGSLSIPVVMVLNGAFEEVAWWGPRPAALQAWVMEEGLEMPKKERYKEVRTWYARDRGKTTLEEVLALVGEPAAAEGRGR